MRYPLSLLAGLTATMLVAPVASAMVITTSTTAPNSNVLASRDALVDLGSYSCERGLGTEVDIGQTFNLPAPAVLDRITVKVRPVTDVAGALAILWVGTFADPAATAMDTLLAAEIRALPNDLEVGGVSYLTFDITNLQLEAHQQYGFVLGFSGGDHAGPGELELLHVDGNTYPSGQAIAWSGLQQEALHDDLVFILQGTGGTTDDTLSLLGGRFAVDVTWSTGTASGPGHPNQLTDETGTFWFFEDSNVELILKVHDACVDPYQRYWVFMAGLTNVEVEVRVRDLQGDFEHVYHSASGTPFPTILDTTVFATCP